MPGSIGKKRRLIRACASMQSNKNGRIYPNQLIELLGKKAMMKER